MPDKYFFKFLLGKIEKIIVKCYLIIIIDQLKTNKNGLLCW